MDLKKVTDLLRAEVESYRKRLAALEKLHYKMSQGGTVGSITGR
jgi:hypothetical protein